MGGTGALLRFHLLAVSDSFRGVSFAGPEHLDGQAKLAWKNSWCRHNRAGKKTLPNAPTKLEKGPSLYLKIKDPRNCVGDSVRRFCWSALLNLDLEADLFLYGSGAQVSGATGTHAGIGVGTGGGGLKYGAVGVNRGIGPGSGICGNSSNGRPT